MKPQRNHFPKKSGIARKKIYFFLMMALPILWMCSPNAPTGLDRSVSLHLYVIDTTQISDDTASVPLADAYVRLILSDYNETYSYHTDAYGYLYLPDIRMGHYLIQAEKRYENINRVGSLDVELSVPNTEYIDTIYVDIASLEGIVINEIYYCGPENSGRFYWDQYIELYNNSDEVQYLDKMIIAKVRPQSQTEDKFQTIYSYRFPGSGASIPVDPGEFVLIAQSARDYIADGTENSIDLSIADWEFYDNARYDTDNEANNLTRMATVQSEGSNDFYMNLYAGEICLIKVHNEDEIEIIQEYYTTFDGNTVISEYFQFPFKRVIDGVSYRKDASYEKTLDKLIDASFSGYDVDRYSGRSIERHEPESGEPGYDTNNSEFDFVTIARPTPKYQHDMSVVISR